MENSYGGKIYTIQDCKDILSSQPSYNSYEEAVITMDIEKYIERLDRDRRESEQRIRQNAENLEKRLTENIERLDRDRRESEQRIREERRESEERWQEQREEDNARHKEQMQNINQRFDRMEIKIETLSKEVHNEGSATRRWMIGTFIAVAGIAVATIVGIVTIVLAIV